MNEKIIAFILGIVEGLTEFLPISSTGHQIIVADLLNFTSEKAIAFNIIIQLAAILAVIWHFREKVWQVLVGFFKFEESAFVLSVNIVVAFLPAAIFGVLFIDKIKMFLFNPVYVAAALIVGGLLMVLAEKVKPKESTVDKIDDVGFLQSLLIGIFQSIAIIPGVSRSAATIIGGRFFGLSRQAATDFSFFLAMPTMLGAATYSIYKYHNSFVMEDWQMLAIGFTTSFIVALLTVKALLKFIATHSYNSFAIYRIFIGLFILITFYTKIIDWSSLSNLGV